jgi:hypothetical protein
MLSAFPLTLVALLLYNLAFFSGLGSGGDMADLLAQNFSLVLPSGARWTVRLSDLFLAFGLLMLVVEILKSRGGRRPADHVFAWASFIAGTAEFLLLKGFATSTFFFLTLFCLADLAIAHGGVLMRRG